MGNGPAEQAAQIEIASAALSNIYAMLPPGETAGLEVRGIGYLTVRGVRNLSQSPEARQTREATVEGRHRAASEAVLGAASRRNDRPGPAGYQSRALDARARPELPEYLARAETHYARETQTTDMPTTYQPYRTEYSHHQASETFWGQSPSDLLSHARQSATRLNDARLDRIETDPARNVLGPLNRIIGDEGVSPTSRPTNRHTTRRTTHSQALPAISPPAAISASSTVRPTRSSTASATLSGPFTDSPSGFDTYRSYWASEEYREGRW